MKMEYTTSCLGGIIRMLQTIKEHTGDDVPIRIRFKGKALFLNYTMVMKNQENKGVVVLEVDSKLFKMKNISHETH